MSVGQHGVGRPVVEWVEFRAAGMFARPPLHCGNADRPRHPGAAGPEPSRLESTDYIELWTELNLLEAF